MIRNVIKYLGPVLSILISLSFFRPISIVYASETISFITKPSYVGSITLDGHTYTNGQTGPYSLGEYTATANVPSGWQFCYWDYDTTIKDTSIHVLNIIVNPTTVDVNGQGWLGLVLGCITTFYTSTGTGSITRGSQTYSNGQTYVEYSIFNGPQTYSLTANPPSTYYFSSWSTTGSVQVGNLSSQSTTLTISGPGTVMANFQGQKTTTFSVSGLSGDASGTVLTVDGDPYSYSDFPKTFTWDTGSTHSYTYQEYVSTSTDGKRYACHSPPQGSITVSSSSSVSASYHTEYRLSISVSPSGAGTTSPASGTYWYDSGSPVSVSAAQNTGYSFSYWMLDVNNAGSNNSISVTANMPHSLQAVFTRATYSLTIQVYKEGENTGIQGVTINVDSSPHTTDQNGRINVTVTYGTHTIGVVSPHSPSTGTRYVYLRWSDSSTSNPKSISVTGSTTLTAYMKLQYYLTTQANPSEGGSVSPASCWCDAGSSITILATVNLGYRFIGWTGSGAYGSYTGTLNPATVTMNAPISETANFIIKPTTANVTFSVSGISGDTTGTVLVVDGDNLVYSELPKTFTWDIDSLHSYEWLSPISFGTGKQYVWVSTSGLSTNRNDEITVAEGSGTITGLYKTQYYLTVISLLGNPSGESWYDSGSPASSSVTSPVLEGTETRYVRTRYIGTGSAPASGTQSTVSFTINSPSTITWNWQIQYLLTVQSGLRDNIEGVDVLYYADNSWYGSKWCNESEVINLRVVSPQGFLVQQVFSRWTGNITSISKTISVFMDGPKEVEAEWITDYTQLFLLVGTASLLFATTGTITYRHGRVKKKHAQLMDKLLKQIHETNTPLIINNFASENAILEDTVRQLIDEAIKDGRLKGRYTMDRKSFITDELLKHIINEKLEPK